jgi:hypothetical protein
MADRLPHAEADPDVGAVVEVALERLPLLALCNVGLRS